MANFPMCSNMIPLLLLFFHLQAGGWEEGSKRLLQFLTAPFLHNLGKGSHFQSTSLILFPRCFYAPRPNKHELLLLCQTPTPPVPVTSPLPHHSHPSCLDHGAEFYYNIFIILFTQAQPWEGQPLLESIWMGLTWLKNTCRPYIDLLGQSQVCGLSERWEDSESFFPIYTAFSEVYCEQIKKKWAWLKASAVCHSNFQGLESNWASLCH